MPATPESNRPETIVAFDYGLRRIGVAVGQQVTGSASPVATLSNSDAGPDWDAVSEILRDWKPARLIVGLPLDVDGQPTETSAQVQKFIKALARFELPVETVDERYSSLEAQELLKSERALGIRKRIKKEMIDAAAAVLIAERWLRR